MELFANLPDQTPVDMPKAAFADRLGVTAGRISQMIGDGLPVLSNGRVPVEAAEAWYRANIRQKANGAKHSADALAAVKTSREQAQLDLLRLELERRRAALIDRKAVVLALFDRGRAERDAHLAWVSRISAPLAEEFALDLSRFFAALDREMRLHLAELADIPLPELLNDA